jgi:hypothetical protein
MRESRTVDLRNNLASLGDMSLQDLDSMERSAFVSTVAELLSILDDAEPVAGFQSTIDNSPKD